MKLFISLDLSSTKLDACFLTSDSDVLLEKAVSNDFEGVSELKHSVFDFIRQYTFSRIVIGMEATGQCSSLPALFFDADEELHSQGVKTTH